MDFLKDILQYQGYSCEYFQVSSNILNFLEKQEILKDLLKYAQISLNIKDIPKDIFKYQQISSNSNHILEDFKVTWHVRGYHQILSKIMDIIEEICKYHFIFQNTKDLLKEIMEEICKQFQILRIALRTSFNILQYACTIMIPLRISPNVFRHLETLRTSSRI